MFNGFAFIYELVMQFFVTLYVMLCLKPKLHRFPTFVTLFIPLMTLNTIYAAGNFNNGIYQYVAFGIFLMSCILLFENKWYTKLVIPLLELFLSLAVNLFYMSFAGMAGIRDYFDDDKMGLVIALLVYFLLGGLVVILWNKKLGKLQISYKYTNTFLLLPLSQMVICFAFQSFLNPFVWGNADFAGGTEYQNSVVLLNIAMLLSVAADVLVFLTYNKVSKNEQMEKELRERDYRERINMEYYKSLEENAQQMRKMRHDFANAIEIANCLAESESPSARESARKMLGSMEEELESIHIERYCRHELLNALLVSKAKECREKGIEVEYKIVVPENIGVEEYDLCRAMTNIIDNSIRAAEISENDKLIEISVEKDGTALIITSKNASVPHIEKKDGKEHGYGLKILKNIADKYDGSFEYEDDKETYRTTLVLNEKENDNK